MRKNLKFVLMSATALLSLGLASCSSNDEEAPVNPTFDGQSVKTSFALNIPRAAKTRMTKVITQENQQFRGMQDIYLIPLISEPTAATVFPFKTINLPSLENTAISTTQSSKIYHDVNIGVGTNNFLFYGEAQYATFSSKADKFSNGILTKSLNATTMNTITTPSGITFDLNPIYDATSEASDFSAAQTFLLDILNGVANVSFTKDGGSTPTEWKKITVATDGLEYQGLVDVYAEFTKTARNGSGPNVKETMKALYNNVHWIYEKATSADVKALCTAIMTKIGDYFTATHDDALHNSGVSATSPDFKPECYTLAYKSTEAKYTEFPKNSFSLPYGAAELTCDGTAATPFAYNSTPVGPGTTAGGANLNLADLCFPASLQYFCNTPAKANNKTVADDEWPKTTATWDAFDTGWTTANGWEGTVLSTTRSIALRNNINYGVAQLKATVKCSNANTEGGKYYLEDNSAARDGVGGTAENIKVEIPADGFTVKGFLIGGQPQQVDWQFLPSATTTRSRIIYDNTLNEAMAAKADEAVGTNYTLVLDNYTTETSQEKVNVAVELENNSGKDFWGYNGLIPAGGTFYMIGQLDPTAKTVTDAFPTDPYRYPETGKVRVFMQDYTTTVNFTIMDLKKAYSTIPDLRVAKLQLGLSVDLLWRAGVTYDVDL